MTHSLKQQLLIWLLVPLLIIMPAAATLQFWLTLQPAKQEIDRQLGDYAIAVASLLKVDGNTVHLNIAPETEHLLRTDQFDTEFFLVVGPDGKIIYGDPALNTEEYNISTGESRYVDREINGRTMRMLIYGVACGHDPCQVRMAETLVKRGMLHNQALISTLISILVLGLTTAGIMLVAVRHGLRPLQDLQDQLADRSLDDLRPLVIDKVPMEVQPLVTALDQLFIRLGESSKVQKSFLADAAHQLRTPLAALQAELELALMEPHPESLNPTLKRLHSSASRAAKLANQLLTIARADPSIQTRTDFALVDLKDIGIWAANEWFHQASAAGVDLGFELDTALVNGQAMLLQELLSNLLHNSIVHAGAGATITVRTYVSEHASIIEVEDDGPGILEAEREKVLQRFARGSDAKGNGSGLGLAIVSELALIHHAQISLVQASAGRGLLVRITFASEQAINLGEFR